MRRPKNSVYVLGNPASVAVVAAGAAYVTWEWWTIGGWSDWTPLLAVVAVGAVWNAREKITAYARWKADWDAMAGETRARRNWQSLKPIGAVLAWVLMALGLTGLDYSQPVHVWAAVGFSVATLGMLWRILRRRSGRVKPGKVVFVTVVAKLRGPSPSRAECARHLPPYCAALLRPETAGV
jgi:hypothetical protein